MVVSPIDLLCVLGRVVVLNRLKGSGSKVTQPIVEEENSPKSHWSLAAGEEAGFRIATEVVWACFERFLAKLVAFLVGHVEGIARMRSKDVQRQSPVCLSFPGDHDHQSAWT
jgi:hypothetical protein